MHYIHPPPQAAADLAKAGGQSLPSPLAGVKTVNHRVKVLRMAFEGAVREGWLPRNVAVDVPALRLPRTGESGSSARRPFTKAAGPFTKAGGQSH